VSEPRASVRARLERALVRIELINPSINALVHLDVPAARARADALDRALAAGARPGPLCGWIISVKESFPVAGWPCTWGCADWVGRCSTRTAPSVTALLEAGAIVIGKSNVPERLRDWQTYNPVYGTTRNPWCLARTPGGSSGGGAAALAAGLVDAELGTDVASSIRTPAHFCGVVGHKPSFGLVPLDGHFPPGPPTWTDLAVAGPMARRARDVDRLLRVLARPGERDAPAWRVRLPPPRTPPTRLAAFRVGWLPELPGLPPARAYRAAMERFQRWLLGQGVRVETLAPESIDAAAMEDAFVRILRAGEADALDASAFAQLQQQVLAGDPADQRYVARVQRVAVQSHRDWRRARHWQLALREWLAALFERLDVLLMPVAMTAAFPIAEAVPRRERTLIIDGRAWDYSAPLAYAALASLGQLPATAMPIGLQGEQDGVVLPVGMQVLAGYLQDRTGLAFAAAVEARLPGGFPAPPPLVA
jgi:amidase